MTGCISQPISWLRLEQFALDRADTSVSEHVAACPACRACLNEIADDIVALPPLAVPARKERRRWWTFALPAGLALAGVAILLFVLRPRETVEDGRTRVKGLGTVELDVVRERGGTVRDDVRTFATGDRWKVVVTCGANQSAWLDVGVVEAGAPQADYPLPPARVVCGNRIVLPGAFALTGDKPHDVCVRVGLDVAPDRALPRRGQANVACITLRAER